MAQITIRQAREVLTRLDEELTEKGEIIITRRGRPLAKIVPIRETRAVPSHRDIRARIARIKRGSEELVREDRNSR